MTSKELITIINKMGSIRDILNNYELLDKIIKYEDRHLIYVFVELLNHSIRTKEVYPRDLVNLKDERIILSLIHEEDLLYRLSYLCFIEDINTQISLFTNPYILNLIADNIINLDNLNLLYIDTRLKIIEGLIKMNYYEKALEITVKINNIMESERNYYEERDKSVPSRW